MIMQAEGERAKCGVESPGLSVSASRRIYFIRHGVTEWNKLYKYQGRTDIPLSQEGEEQAYRAALRLSRLRTVPNNILVSPLSRAYRTAEIIADVLQIHKIEICKELTEIDFGVWEGLTVPDIIAKTDVAVFDRWRRSQLSVTAPGGEDHMDILKRCANVSKMLLSKRTGDTIIVGHGAFFRTLFVSLLDIGVTDVFWHMGIDNCSITAVDVTAGMKGVIAYFNDNLHNKCELCEVLNIPLF